ncbi:phosphoenolpyruvate--protein phosphotransferase [Benzoatithermus flavus]|uniref:Phosphoenolpyruvate--protein phosphotransferase n=1 Tax=Benzoatithermus flavus TaxID=3108223 RepID=A0ABU8XVG4_9PROT
MSRERVALVLVSHSRALAEATAALARQMTGDAVAIRCAAGVGESGEGFGTDTLRIVEALGETDGPAGTVVLMDLGSALLSAEMALDFLDEAARARVTLCPAPFVEGAVAAAVAAMGGADRATVAAEAKAALEPKHQQLGETEPGRPAAAEPTGAVDAEATIPDPHGLHARPAARLAALASRLGGGVTVENLDNGRGPVSAGSLVALLSLGAAQGHRLRIRAGDPAAARAIADLVATFTGDTEAAPTPPQTEGRAIPVSPGVALGPLVRLAPPPVPEPEAPPADPAAERRRLGAALATVRERLETAAQSGRAGEFLAVQAALLADPALAMRAVALVETGLGAATALARAADEAAAVFREQPDSYLRAREADLRDAVAAVQRELAGALGALRLPEGRCILLADDLPPSLAAALDPAQVLGVIDRQGGPTSHAAILLRAAGIPAVAGAAAQVPADATGLVAIDGGTGAVWLDPDPATRAAIAARLEAVTRTATPVPGGVVTLADGRTVQLWANVSGRAEAEAARRTGAFGIGLLRTEMLFLDRRDPPGEEEQVAALAAILVPFAGRPVVVRTLDAGGDKPIPYMGLAPEANPYLGLRGLRLSLAREPLFRTQLRAVLRAGHGHDLRLLLPMVTDPDEVAAARAVLEEAHRSLEGIPHLWPVPVGIMVEVPAAALLIERFVPVADFFSIGTNDLTQYVLAAERGHPALGRFADATHPAVLDLVRRVARAGRPASVCGEAAGDPDAACALVGQGIERLSMGATAIPRVAEALRRL